MKRCLAAAVVALAWGHESAWAQAPSRLGLALICPGAEPRWVLAQRSIEREWTTRGDSAAAGGLEGARSEPGALALSAVVPGAGQLYAGRAAGFYFAAAEVAGWVGWALLHRDADRLRDDAGAVAGAPDDSASAWSFERWEDATLDDASTLRALYAADREAFYDAIASDERYLPGWSDGETRSRFGSLRRRSDQRLERARWTGAGLWLNHLLAAADALRAARLYNLDLELAGNLELKTRGRWADGGPGVVFTLQRRF